MTTPSFSYDWVREIKPNLKQLDSIPLTGNHPPFPWDDFSARLGRSFDREELKIHPGEMTWRAKENLYEGLGDTPFPLTISIPLLKGQVTWVMPYQEILFLATLLLTKETHPLPLHDQAFNESFYHFLALEIVYHFTQVTFDQTLSPILINQTILPDTDSLCWDISCQIHNHTMWGRLIISPEFRQSWVEHFAEQQGTSQLTQQLAQLADVTVHLEAGKTNLNLAEWKSIKLGDFLILDSCSLDAERLDGRIMLTINGKSTFRAKLKDGTLKILEPPLLNEVETPMAKKIEDEDFSDLDLPEDENDTELEDSDLFSETEGDNLFTETEDDDLPSETENDSLFIETEEEKSDTTISEENSLIEDKTNEKSEKANQLFTPEQIPITLTVEVGQVHMTIEQLLKLEPGNLLDINLHPKNGVDLTINGKIVGKGELIRIGDIIGVRILQLGHK